MVSVYTNLFWISELSVTTRQILATSFDQDAHIDLQPFALHVDERIVDRLENYVYSALSLSERLKGKKGSSEDLRYGDINPEPF